MQAHEGPTTSLPSGLHRYAGQLEALSVRLSFGQLEDPSRAGQEQQESACIKAIKSFLLRPGPSRLAGQPEWLLEPEVEAQAEQPLGLELSVCVGEPRCGRAGPGSWLGSCPARKLADVSLTGYATGGKSARCESVARVARKLPQGAFNARNKATSCPLSSVFSSQLAATLCCSTEDCRLPGKPALNHLGLAGPNSDLDWTRKGSDTDLADERDLVSDSGQSLLLNRAPRSAPIGPDLALSQRQAATLESLDPLGFLVSQLNSNKRRKDDHQQQHDKDIDTCRSEDAKATMRTDSDTDNSGSKGNCEQLPLGSQREFGSMTSQRCTAEIQRLSQHTRLDVEHHNVDGTAEIAAPIGGAETKANRDGAKDTCLAAGLLGTGCARQTIRFMMENHGFSSNGSAAPVARTVAREAPGRPSDNARAGSARPPPTQRPSAGALCLASLRVDPLRRTVRFRPELGQRVALAERLVYWLHLGPAGAEPERWPRARLERARHALLAPAAEPAPVHAPAHGAPPAELGVQLQVHWAHPLEPALARTSLFLRYQLLLNRRLLCSGSSLTSRPNRRGKFNLACLERLLLVRPARHDQLLLSFQLFSSDFYRDALEGYAQVRLPVALAAELGGAERNRLKLELPVIKPKLCSLRDKIRYKLTGQLPSGWRKVLCDNVSSCALDIIAYLALLDLFRRECSRAS